MRGSNSRRSASVLVNYLTDAEGRAAAAANATQIDRAWDLWQMRVEGKL
jgi:hypothetical protein